VTQRLKEITVDPKTVVLSKKVDAAAVGTPKPAKDLQAGVYHYQAKIAGGGQEIPIKLTTTIKEEGGAWIATDVMETPQGQGTDTVTMEKGSLVVRNRAISQGPISVKIDFAGNKAAGSMSMNGQERPIAADLGGALFADSAGGLQSIANLPLADGYTTNYRNFDVQKQKVKLMQLTVAGSESVTVPAGTFDSFKVEITSGDGGADKQTLWVAKETRKPVKMASVMGSMGGATMTAELMP